MTEENAVKIAENIDTLKEVDFMTNGKISGFKYLRIRVEIDTRLPIQTGFNRNKEANQKAWIQLQYERLSDFCFNCGRLGHGNPYTWFNNRPLSENINERLDKAYGNTQWRILFPDVTVTHLPGKSSDHLPILIRTHKSYNLGPKPFRFVAPWTRDATSHLIVKSAWRQSVMGSDAEILSQKTAITSQALQCWNLSHFGHIQTRLKNLSQKLNPIQQQEPTIENMEIEKYLTIEIDEQRKREESLWHQKFRVQLRTEGDLNTKFLHLSTLIRCRRNAIDFIKNSEGKWISSREEIRDCLTSVWPEHSSFSSEGLGPVPDRFRGVCETGDSFTTDHCNRKLIGARYYYRGFERDMGSLSEGFHFLSPRDDFRHGSHTASIAVGAVVTDLSDSFFGNCADIAKAFDDAIDDNVDIISMSLGQSGTDADFINDCFSLGALHAFQNGILVSASAGNNAEPYTVDNAAPWILTVAASSVDREFDSRVELGNGDSLKVRIRIQF
ncbi:hypothetical protein RJ639_012839 [Escallonia herrerae]|uniref:Peptidase S8/S53 domain-containing protein n=1 Tax=Escallonia herrerae TaxID=1293975 RepID=A0AA89AMM3_9ASTE|nr:hypothetical protein RJ639_012839 [Escallonia herrerae]